MCVLVLHCFPSSNATALDYLYQHVSVWKHRLSLYIGFALGLRWVCVGFALGLRWVCVGFALGLRWVCVGFALGLRWVCVGFALGLRWVCVGFALGLRWVCVGFAQIGQCKVPQRNDENAW